MQLNYWCTAQFPTTESRWGGSSGYYWYPNGPDSFNLTDKNCQKVSTSGLGTGLPLQEIMDLPLPQVMFLNLLTCGYSIVRIIHTKNTWKIRAN